MYAVSEIQLPKRTGVRVWGGGACVRACVYIYIIYVYVCVSCSVCVCVCVSVCVCVCDEMSVSLCLCKRSGLLRDGALTRWGAINNLSLLLLLVITM